MSLGLIVYGLEFKVVVTQLTQRVFMLALLKTRSTQRVRWGSRAGSSNSLMFKVWVTEVAK
jgi:hypothetical protein